MTDLGTVGGDACSVGFSVNATGQVVGISVAAALPIGCDFSQARASLWEDGGPMVDLNALIPPDPALFLTSPETINNLGEIAGLGVDSAGNQHAFLLIPCDEDHHGLEGCDYSFVDGATAAARVRPGAITQAPTSRLAKLSPAEMMTRFRLFGAGSNRRFGTLQSSQKTALSGEATISAPTWSFLIRVSCWDLLEGSFLVPVGIRDSRPFAGNSARPESRNHLCPHPGAHCLLRVSVRLLPPSVHSHNYSRINTLSARADWRLDCIKYQKRGAIVTTPWQVCERGRAERSARSLLG
jgi:probable HAF family extracellular repeat protein